MNNSGMELNAVLHAPGVPEKNDPPVKKGDVFKNSQNESHVVVERVSQGEDGPIIYSSQDGSRDRRILGRPLKNFLVDVGVRDMEMIDPIQNREPVFYAAYERQMTILEKAFAREFFACEKALDAHEDSLKGRGKAVFIALGMIGLNRQKMNEIADEWERMDDRLVRGGRRRLALLAEIRNFSQERFEGDLLKWKNEALEELTGEYGSDEPDELLVERGYFRDVLHGKADRLLKKCRQVKSGKLKISDEVASLPTFEREVKRLKDSIVGYESGDVDKESATIEIKAVLDALAEMDRVAFHRSVGDERESGENAERKKSPRRMKKDESEDITKKKPEGRNRRKTNKRDMLAPDETALPVSPIISENGVQSEENPNVTTIGENVSDQPMKKPTESMPVAPSPEKGQEVLTAFKEAVEKEKQVFFGAIENAGTFKALRGVGLVVGRMRKFFVENGEGASPVVLEFVGKIKGGDTANALEILDEANREIKKAWDKKKLLLEKEKEAGSPKDTFSVLVKVLGARIMPFKKDEKELVIDSVSPEEIRFKYRGDETKGEWVIGKIGASRAEEFAKDLKKNFNFSLRERKESPPKRRVTAEKKGPAVDATVQPAVEAVKITPENLAKSSERTYEDFFREADDKGYHDILFGAAAAGIRTMKEGAQKESVDLREYDKGHPGEILEALIDGMKDSLARVGKELGWSESEIDIYARGLVQKSIEKYLK